MIRIGNRGSFSHGAKLRARLLDKATDKTHRHQAATTNHEATVCAELDADIVGSAALHNNFAKLGIIYDSWLAWHGLLDIDVATVNAGALLNW